MSKNSGIPISQAFSCSLRQLAITEFPCGDGKWVYPLLVLDTCIAEFMMSILKT